MSSALMARLRNLEDRANVRGPAVVFLNPDRPGYADALKRVEKHRADGRSLIVYTGTIFPNTRAGR